MKGYILAGSVVLGFLIASFFAGRKEGEEGRLKSLKLEVGEKIVHLHHWILGSAFLVILLLTDNYNPWIAGFLVGIVLQGLTYNDFYRIVYSE